MRQVLLFAAWAWANAEACASCQGKAWTRRSGNDDNNNAISLNSRGVFEQFACGTVPASHADMGKRASVKDDCSDKNAVETALKTCVQYAEAGAKEANNKEGQLFEYFFKKDNDAKRGEVAGYFQEIAKECGAAQGGGISVTCTDGTIEKCTGADGTDYTAWANKKQGSTPGSIVQLCKPFFGSMGGGCGQLDRPGVFVHEFSHALVGTEDFNGGYGMAAVLQLSASQNLQHADTFALFAQAASLGCTTEQLKGTPQGTQPPPGQGNQPPPGQGNQPPPGQGNQPPPGQGNQPPPGQGTQPPPGQGTQPPWQWTQWQWWTGSTPKQGTGSTPEQGDRIVSGA